MVKARWREIKWLLALVTVVATMAGWGQAEANEITDVLDVDDEEYFDDPTSDDRRPVYDPYDFDLNVRFQQTFERMKINREKCARSDRCLDAGDDSRYNKEMRYERSISQVDLDFEAAIWRDLEFTFTLPIIISDQRQYKYARNGSSACEFDTNPDDPKCVNATNSTVDPSDARIGADAADTGDVTDDFPDGFGTYRYFDLPDDSDAWLEGPDRSGVGDMSFALDWAIINDYRYFPDAGPTSPWYLEHGRASLVLGMKYTAPTAEIAEVTNDAVGQGVHWLSWRLASSRRYRFVEPYTQFTFTLPIPSDSSVFRDYGGGQERVGPGMRGDIVLGVNFVPWEDRPLSSSPGMGDTTNYSGEWRRAMIDLRATFGFVAEGREYGALFDAIGQSACQGITYGELGSRPECAWIAEKWANAGFEQVSQLDPYRTRADGSEGPEDDLVLRDDGITSYESYGHAGLRLGFDIQPTKWVSLNLFAAFRYQQDRFITFAKAGQDVRGRVDVDGRSVPGEDGVTDGTVSFDDILERNPVYNPTYDVVGRRFRAAENTIFSWGVTLTGHFP